MRVAAAERDAAEEKRIFYVAATRARDRLIVSGAASARGAASALKPMGWAALTVENLEIPLGRPAILDFEGFTLECSSLDNYKPYRTRHGATLLSWREALLRGETVPVSGHPCADAAEILSRVAPLSASSAGPSRFTATQIADFGRCPLRYELLHLRRLPPDFILQPSREESSGLPGHLVGTVLHEVFERVRGEGLAAALDKVLSSNPDYASVESTLRAECLPIIRRAETSAFYRRISAARGGRETSFSFLFDDFLVEGKIDRTLPGEIIDFKSDDVAEGSLAEYAEHYRPQMDVYVLAAKRLQGAAPGLVTLYFLRPGREVSWKYGDSGVAGAESRLRATISSIVEGAPFAARRRGDCRCEYRSLCSIVAARRPTPE
jgi:ATP-dependent helicase/nuclease subunit A